MRAWNFKRYWNDAKLLTWIINVCASVALLTTLGMFYFTSKADDDRNGLNFYYETTSNYTAKEDLMQLLLANPQLNYDSVLPQSAYLAYLKNVDSRYRSITSQTDLASKIRTVKDYDHLRTTNPINDDNSWITKFSNKLILHVWLVNVLTFLSIVFQTFNVILSFRRDKIQKMNSKV